MSRFQAERLLLGCAGESAVLLAEPASATAAVDALLSLAFKHPQPPASNALCAALQGLKLDSRLPTASTRSLTVTLDDGLVRGFVVTPARGTRGLRELQATAAARFATLFDESAEHWVLVADWHATAPFVACALPRVLHQALDQLARTHGWRLDSLSPAFARVWNRVCDSIPADGWLLVGFGQTLTLLATREEQVVGLRTLRLAHAPDFAELETLLEQEVLRSPLEGETGHRQSLLWAGAADWLPAGATLAGLASRTIRFPKLEAHASEPSTAAQLALAGGRQ